MENGPLAVGAGGPLAKSDFPMRSSCEIFTGGTARNSKTFCSEKIPKKCPRGAPRASEFRKSTYFDPPLLGTGSSYDLAKNVFG